MLTDNILQIIAINDIKELMRLTLKQLLVYLIIIVLLTVPSNSCHYTCSECQDNLYNRCMKCLDNKTLKNSYSSIPAKGYCSTIHSENVNILGIILFILLIFICYMLPQQQIYYFALLLQTLSLLFLVQAIWFPIHDYILSSFTYFMIFSKISYIYKDSQNISIQDITKSQIFFKTSLISQNIMLIGIVNLILILMMLIVPFIKIIGKCLDGQGPRRCSLTNLTKLQYVIQVLFMFTMQQSCLIMFFSFKYGQITANIIFFIVYILSLIFFIVNQFYSPFAFFRSKSSQIIVLLSKIIIPLFIVFQKQAHFILLIFIILFYILDLMATHKNVNNSTYNRLLLIKIYAMVSILLFLVNYIIQIAINSSILSKGFGILSTILTIGLINLFLIEVIIQIKGKVQNSNPKSYPHENTIQIIKNNILHEIVHCTTEQNLKNANINDKMVAPEVIDNQDMNSILNQRSQNNNYGTIQYKNDTFMNQKRIKFQNLILEINGKQVNHSRQQNGQETIKQQQKSQEKFTKKQGNDVQLEVDFQNINFQFQQNIINKEQCQNEDNFEDIQPVDLFKIKKAARKKRTQKKKKIQIIQE